MCDAISYIIPAYNCESTIEESLHSIVNGNYRTGDEIIIVDDASTDTTPALLEKFAARYANVRVMRHASNKGGAAARNTAVENAGNPLVFCLDSDNVLKPGTVDKLQRLLVENAADVASFQQLHFFTSATAEITHRWIFQPGIITLADCLSGPVAPIASGNYLYSKRSWRRAGGYPEFAGALDAWGFGLRQMATGSKMVVLPDSFYYHRYGHESYWVREARKGGNSSKALRIITPYLDLLTDEDVEYITGEEGRSVWFEQLKQRPLKLKTGEIGRTGVIVHSPEPCFLKRIAAMLATRVKRAIAGQ